MTPGHAPHGEINLSRHNHPYREQKRGNQSDLIDGDDVTDYSKSAIRDLIHTRIARMYKYDLFSQDYVEQHLLAAHRRGCRPSTIKSYCTIIFQFFFYLRRNGHRCIETLTRNDVGGFIEQEQDRGLAPSSVSCKLRAIYTFLAFLVDQDIVNPSLLTKKLHIKVPDTLPKAIDPIDVHALIKAVKKPRSKAIILTLLRTGMRIGELLNTRIADINFKEKRIEIFEAQKNRAGRVVYISDDASRVLRKWLKKHGRHTEYLFYGYNGRPLSYEAARIMFKKSLQDAGLEHKGYTLHCLRHTFASEMLNVGMRLECVQQLLGHSSIEMTRRYARLTDVTRRREYFEAMARIERGGIDGHYRSDLELPPVH